MTEQPLSGQRVLIIAGHVYEDLELHYPRLRMIEAGAEVDLVVCDKRVHIGEGAVVGHGDEEAKKMSNQDYPTHLYSGITLIGKEVLVPAKMKIGRNCIIRPGKKGRDERVFPAELQHGGIF